MKIPLKYTLIFLTCQLFHAEVYSQEPYKDPVLPVDERVDDLISRMTLQEKISQLGNQSAAVSRLGLASYNYWSEGLHGVARAGLATSFPQAIALSSTWNPDLVYQVASVTSDEARVKNNTNGKGLTYWSPTINMARDPRWGRSEENYGEDPFLASRIAVSFIRGMQGNDPNYLKTVATAKHFACNNIEYNRYGISSDVDERSFREYYLPAFEASVREAKVYSIMSAYNAVNSVPSPVNRTLLTHILRNEWGFSGYVVSDCDAVRNVWDSHHYVATAAEATALSIHNGGDLNCGTTFPSNAGSAISQGLLSEADIDTALHHILKARFLLGEFDPASSVPYRSIPDSLLDCESNRQLALQTARESIVLLKNENSILPLDIDGIDTIAILGPNADVLQLGGYSGNPAVSVTALEGIAARLGVDISNGTIEAENYTSQSGIQTEDCQEGGSNIGYIENGDYAVYDDIDFSVGVSKLDVRIASQTDGGTLEVLLDGMSGTSLGSFSISGTGAWQNWTTLTVDLPETSGMHDIYLKFSGGSGYLYNINWFRFYNEGDPDPTDGYGRIKYASGCSITGSLDQAEFDKAIEFARNSDVAIVVCGTDLSVANESRDRSSLGLPGVQEELVKEVYRVNPKTILVLVTGASLAVNWEQDSIPAILASWYNGQSQGTALAQILFGDYNPKGKLTTTWYRSVNDLPAMDDYNVKNNRTYMYFTGTPLYPFGYGLSYTSFEYSNLDLGPDILNAGDSILVSADITNSGNMAGEEIVQLYVSVESDMIRPVKELKGFASVYLEPGETRTVEIPLKHEALTYFDETEKAFMVETGKAEILVGSSSQDIQLNGQIALNGGMIRKTYRQDPYVRTEAEHLENKSSDVKISSCSEGGRCIESINYNSYILFRNFEFSEGAKQFNAFISSVAGEATIEIIPDSLNGEMAGLLDIRTTLDPDNYQKQSCRVDFPSGARDLYLVFKTNTENSLRLDWFNFQTAVDENLGLSNINSDFYVNIFPNPSDENIHVKYQLKIPSDVSIKLFNTRGVMIALFKKGKQPPGAYLEQMGTGDLKLEPGMYILQFTAGNNTETFKARIL